MKQEKKTIGKQFQASSARHYKKIKIIDFI